MPRIELILPGEPKTTGEPFADVYRITIERGDGIACDDMEARTTMSMFCIHAATKKKPKARKRKVASSAPEVG